MGKKVTIGGEPHFSPSGKRFAVAVPSEAGGFNGVQVWHWQDNEAAIEFGHEPQEYALYEFSGWDGGDKVLLKATTWIDHNLAEAPAKLAKTDSGWILAGPVEAPT